MSLAWTVRLPHVALAHGGVTGAQDIMQDYGVLLFLAGIVLVGAGVVAWVVLAPAEADSEDASDPAGHLNRSSDRASAGIPGAATSERTTTAEDKQEPAPRSR